MTPLQNQGNAILNAMDDATLMTVMTLYDRGFLNTFKTMSRRADTSNYLVNVLGMKREVADAVLDEYGVVA